MQLNLDTPCTLTLLAGYPKPEFSLGQSVQWLFHSQVLSIDLEAWGEVIGLTYWEGEYLYDICVSSDCPLAMTYSNWANHVETLSGDTLTARN